MTQNEMKQVLGGSAFTCSSGACSGSCTVGQYTGTCGNSRGMGCTCAYTIAG